MCGPLLGRVGSHVADGGAGAAAARPILPDHPWIRGTVVIDMLDTVVRIGEGNMKSKQGTGRYGRSIFIGLR